MYMYLYGQKNIVLYCLSKIVCASTCTCTVFPRLDATATIYFVSPGPAATIRGWRLLEEIRYMPNFVCIVYSQRVFRPLL